MDGGGAACAAPFFVLIDGLDVDALVDGFCLLEGGEADAGEHGRGGAGGDAPAEGVVEGFALAHGPGKGGGKSVAGADGADGIDARRTALEDAIFTATDGAAGAEGEHDRVGAHFANALGGLDKVRTGEQGAAKESLGLGLIGGDNGGARLDGEGEGVAIGIEQSLDVVGAGGGDEARVEIGRDAGRHAAAEHEPFRLGEAARDGVFDGLYFRSGERGAALVELHAQALTVGDGEVVPDGVLHGHKLTGEAIASQQLLEGGRTGAAGVGDGEGFAAEGVDDARGIDAAAAGGLESVENVGAIFKDKLIGRDVLVDGWIEGDADDQVSIVLSVV